MKIFKIVSIVGFAIIASACGNIQQGTEDYRTENFGQYTDANSANPYLSAAQTCSENPNISSPVYQYATNAQYRACKANNNNVMNVKIFTADETARNVCIFPVSITGTSASPFVVNPYAPAASRFAMQCVNTSGNGATVSFGSLPVNGIYVVEQANAAQFATCLSVANVRACATNSGFTYSQGTL